MFKFQNPFNCAIKESPPKLQFKEINLQHCCLVTKSYPTLYVIPWTVALQAPLSMGFPKQEYWSGLPFPFPRDLPNPGIKSMSPLSPALQTDSLPSKPLGKPENKLGFSLL